MARILIVDDERYSRDLLLTLLGYRNHVVLQACDGAEGLALALAEQPDLIVTDVVMPEMDGYLFAQRVHADPALAHTRVLFYTAADMGTEERKLASACGVTHILAKPAEPEIILATVKAALDSAAPAAQRMPDSERDHVYLRLLTNTLHQKVEALKSEVDARAQAEGAVRRLNAELERRLAELTAVNLQLQREAADRKQMEIELANRQAQLASIVDSAMDAIIAVDDDQSIVIWNAAAERMFGCPAAEVLGQPLDRFIPARYRDIHRAHIRAFGCTGATARAMGGLRPLTGLRTNGEEFPIEASISQVMITGRKLYTVIVRDITERMRAEIALQAALTAELAARQTAENLQASSQALAASLDLDTVLAALLERLEQIVPYDSATVMLLEDDTQLIVAATRGYERWLDPDEARDVGFDIEANPLFHALLAERKSILISDTTEYAQWEQPVGAEHVYSWLGVPLIAGGTVIGLYSVDKTEPGFFTAAHVRLAEALATQAAVAIQNARLFAEVHQGRAHLQTLSHRLVEVQEAERRQIARELHDEIGQVLTGLKLTLDMAARLPSSQVAGRLEEARAVLNDLMGRVRNLSLDLRPTMLDDMGLLPALQWHFERYTGQTDVQVICRHNGVDRRFTAEVETTVYRIIQEALTNVARYADVNEASVLLLADQKWMRVRIDDHGRGFDPNRLLTAHTTSGLTGMRERAALLGGELTIESTPGGGTHVIAELPLEA